MESEREDLDGLLRSAGWARFVQHVEREWGSADGGGQMYHRAVTKAADEADDLGALAKLRQIVVAQREIHRLMAWAKDRLVVVTKSEQDPVGAGQSRRGGL